MVLHVVLYPMYPVWHLSHWDPAKFVRHLSQASPPKPWSHLQRGAEAPVGTRHSPFPLHCPGQTRSEQLSPANPGKHTQVAVLFFSTQWPQSEQSGSPVDSHVGYEITVDRCRKMLYMYIYEISSRITHINHLINQRRTKVNELNLLFH